MKSTTMNVGDIRMRWEEEGDGLPLVLVHGIPTSPALWRHVVPLVNGRVMAWEMVGYGESIPQGVDRDISVSAQADHLLAWMGAMHVDRAVVVGHDLGGGVAQIAAVRAPDRFAGMVLTNAIAYDSWPIPSVKVMRALAPVAARTPDPAFRVLLAQLMHRGHDRRAQASEALRVHVRPYLDHDGAAAMIRQVKSLDVNDTLAFQDQLGSLDIPARVVWGAADQFQKIHYGERLASDLRAPLHRIEGGKHFTPEDHPHAIADAVNSLARDVASSS